METTQILTKVIGPVLLIRGISIVFDREHFTAMLDGLTEEVKTISFSLVPIAIFMSCIAIANVHTDTSSLAAIFIHIIAWGGMIKATALIMAPNLTVAKAQMLGKAGFLNVVIVVCLAVGIYFTWFGYFGG